MDMSGSPAMSVVVITPDSYETVRKTIRHLRAQRVRDRLEIVLVAPDAGKLAADEKELRDFQGLRVVEIGDMLSTARARAAGVRAASAPIVAFVEDHAFPAPGWAEALIGAHQNGWAAVGPVMANANPRSLTSWVNLAVEYSQWLEPQTGGEREHLPGHNGSYKRALLFEYGDRLEEMLDAESVLHWDLRAKGHGLYLEPKARTFHQNFSIFLPSITLRFQGGRLFAAARARRWPHRRRLLFMCGAPLIPLVRFIRIVHDLRRGDGSRRLLPRIVPGLFAALIFDGLGEMVGYSLGPGRAMEKLSDMEFHRQRYLHKTDRHGDVELRALDANDSLSISSQEITPREV
jgi:glycosyltransferase involved in cell wall biosynthesis